MDRRERRRTAALQALAAVCIWRAAFAATKQLLAQLAPETLLFARTVLGAGLIAGGLAARGRLLVLPARAWPHVVSLAVAGLVLTQGLQAHALVRSTSATTAWLVAL